MTTDGLPHQRPRSSLKPQSPRWSLHGHLLTKGDAKFTLTLGVQYKICLPLQFMHGNVGPNTWCCVYLGLLQNGLSLRLLCRNRHTCLGVSTSLELHKHIYGSIRNTERVQIKLNAPPSGQSVSLQFGPNKHRQAEEQEKWESINNSRGKLNSQVIYVQF